MRNERIAKVELAIYGVGQGGKVMGLFVGVEVEYECSFFFYPSSGGNLLTKTPRDALTIIENKSKVHNSQNKPIVSKVSTNAPSSSTPHSLEISALVDAVKAMLHQKSSPPMSCHRCLATDGNVFMKYQDNIQGYVSTVAVNYNQGNTGYRPQSVANQIRPSGFSQPNVQNN
ncbi:hypothetical protein Tco_0533512 [Tanacetum coccineum]